MKLTTLLTLWVATPVFALPVETLFTTGPSTNRTDLVILGDGYRVQDQAKLTADATAVVTALFDLAPYKDYKGLFNVKLIKVISVDQGADNGSYGAVRDTALGSYFNCFGIDRLLCANDATVLTIAAANVPEYDVAIVLVNDPKYGGAGGAVPTASTNAQSSEILRHEVGHTIGKLADEYVSPGVTAVCPLPDCTESNATSVLQPGSLKWKVWLDPSTPVPTPLSFTGVGLFLGGRYSATGIYRPVNNTCLMNVLGVPFCSVCAEGMVRSFYNRVEPIDSVTPPPNVQLGFCQSVRLSVQQPLVVPARWTYQWQLDDGGTRDGGVSDVVTAQSLSEGAHRVTVFVKDNTPYVRADPLKLLNDSAQWTLTVDAGGQQCLPGLCDLAQCDGMGSCIRTPKANGTLCGVASCIDGSATSPPLCQASACVKPSPTSCGLYKCDDAQLACLTTCRTDADCLGGTRCSQGVCAFVSSSVSEVAGTKAAVPACGCSAGASLPGLALLLLGVLRARRTRRHSARG